MLIVFSILMILILGIAVGANGVFKGVATAIGSKLLGATYARFLSILFAGIGGSISLKLFPDLFLLSWEPGFVPISEVNPSFALSVCLAAATTLGISTRLGFANSSSVVLLGATMGAGLVSTKMQIGMHLLPNTTFFWFAATPFVAWIAAALMHVGFKRLSFLLSCKRQTLLILDRELVAVVPQGENPFATMSLMRNKLNMDSETASRMTVKESYAGSAFGVSIEKIVNNLHVVSIALISCIWGVLEVQKLLLVSMVIDANSVFIYGAVGLVGILIGGFFFGKNVNATLSDKMCVLTQGSGFAASLSTFAALMLSAIVAIPGSLTYAVGGSLMGVGMAGERIKMEQCIYVMAAWVVTWPVSMALGGVFYLGITDLFS